MTSLQDHLVLERTGPADATVGLFSLPLPQANANDLSLDHAVAGLQPLAWWRKNQTPRRVLACVVDDAGVPETLSLKSGGATAGTGSRPWTLETRITKQQLEFTAHPFKNIAQLRGVPEHECTTVEYELLLGYGGKTLALQFGSTGPKEGGPYYWQNVQIDRLWENEAAQAVRVGGIIYNEDTYLWADVYLLLFANGVAQAAAHFVTTKLHIEGYDFHGLPLVHFSGDGVQGVTATTPADGARFDLGAVKLNLDDAISLSSDEFPGQIKTTEAGGAIWYPVSQIFNPQHAENGEIEWPAGFARTMRFHFSLSDAAPVVARYRVPAWWYAKCGEPWPWDLLPVRGRFDVLGEMTSDEIRSQFITGRFHANSAGDLLNPDPKLRSHGGNDGDSGVGMMQNAYHTGDDDLYRDALNYCYYWADIAIDHRDFSVHQWVGGWGWKTCAYSKFRDVLYGYLETGDPNFKDTAEMAAEAYWTWFRSNWPRNSIGRDSYEVGAWALLWRFFDTEHAADRCREFVRMMGNVIESRGVIGGQMGAGPHPGFHASLYMTGVSMISLLDVAEAAVQHGDVALLNKIRPLLETLHGHYLNDEIELFPSSFGTTRADWNPAGHAIWAAMGLRIYPEIARLQGTEDATTDAGMRRTLEVSTHPFEEWSKDGRLGNQLVHPIYHDALMLGARWTGEGVEIAPLGEPDMWPEQQVVETPVGNLMVVREDDTLRFEAETEFPVILQYRGVVVETTSQGSSAQAGERELVGQV